MIMAILAATIIATTKLRYQLCSYWLLGEDLCQPGYLWPRVAVCIAPAVKN